MEISVLSGKDNTLKVVLENAKPSDANALRRIILGEVPVLAVDDVIIHENSSPLFDEALAHRIGLMPIRVDAIDLDRFNFREECSCKGEGCAECTVNFSLDIEGPITVYSHDFKSEDPEIKPVEGIPIVKLGKNQKVVLESEAVLGRGREHAKWQPAVVGYKYYPVITINENCTGCKDCVEACPRDILTFEEGKVIVNNIENCSICKACADVCEDGTIVVKGDPTKFIFTIEGLGSIEPMEIFKRACDVIVEKTDKLYELIKP
ncbi:MAG TPA: DNA-directed RNA polymerase subunit D [Euryarchaeota archaeon]|nr:DNA-directed RNA polymerase subunit D [archaeon BMS3Bbin15]HDL15073.1 DNA-directed RNA polymerase subunit D [Euryarchaeota archaeon]